MATVAGVHGRLLSNSDVTTKFRYLIGIGVGVCAYPAKPNHRSHKSIFDLLVGKEKLLPTRDMFTQAHKDDVFDVKRLTHQSVNIYGPLSERQKNIYIKTMNFEPA
ncbi:hypothetical protein Smp_028640 [Schistosoma mansoni]|uniref:hypothetical protein n=1 Tax=Schistosoma mansoni TaxID=6183 RepID=UPI0001A635EC|nr:hypothetical protein Smp_028640 [Schistosoma mansoni]|eukprot:XP_018653837.1 hypothetical protein Smp_028640 [Schistosoma mansoni]